MIVTKKQLERMFNNTLLTTYTYLKKVLAEYKVSCEHLDFDYYINQLNKINKELKK